MFYNGYKILFSLDQNLQSVFASFSEHIENDSSAVFTISTPYSPKGYPAGRVISTLLTVLLVQPITYTVSSCLATGSYHISNSLNGMSRSHAAHKWLSKAHQLTP